MKKMITVLYHSSFLSLSLIFFLINYNFMINCQEILSNRGSIKYALSTISTPSDNISDRSHHEIEVESKFIIKNNIIIRTGESRALGATYINETRMPSNHECLIWCLETPYCNAAVYEEKNMQSCYMFDCGSPAKPLCRFTQHDFFTSSVLKMTKHSYELRQWGKQVQQEKANTERHNDISTSTTPVPVDKNLISTSSLLPTNGGQLPKEGTLCHRYQFQCANNSDCIAIYNVCDGIPQCPDESDESPDLQCPTRDVPKKSINNKDRLVETPPPVENKAPPTKLVPPSARPSPAFTNIQNVPSYKKPPEHKDVQHADYKGMWPSSSYSRPQKTKNGYRHRVDDSDSLSSPFVHKHSQFISANDPHVQNLNRWAHSDYDQYPSHATSLEQQYSPYDRMDEKDRLEYISKQISPDYDIPKNFPDDRDDDISFWPSQDIIPDSSYTIEEFPQSGVHSLEKGIGYPDKENIYAQQIARTAEQYPETKLSRHKQLLNQNLPPDMDDYSLRRYPHPRNKQPYLNLDEAVPQQYYPETRTKGMQDYKIGLQGLQDRDDSPYNNDDLIRASIVNQLPKKLDHIRRPPEHALKHLDTDMLRPLPKENAIVQSTEATKEDSLITVKPTSQNAHTKSIQRTVLDFKMSVAELYQSSTTHSHEANSAILALVVGVTVSFFLMLLLACRLKTLRRRMSRKGRALAHDADYLVNGMYL